ncbi:SpvB/TcaC N-terminal domain-containing protein [Rhizobium johnstonii]|uniref:SpvB/TcaC N-terminal domain-containing protein n=1 Tax=Rhizobium johnstonii TaxID=3019933 RepID=UPI003F9D8C2E
MTARGPISSSRDSGAAIGPDQPWNSQPNSPISAPSLSLPKGGGALRGIGEKFSFNAQTGTGTISIPLPFNQTRGDLQPSLTLSYDSGAGNGIFGVGWQLGLASISRKTEKGLPKYDDLTPTDVFVFSGAEDLVPTTPDHLQSRDAYLVRRFRPRVEGGFARIEWWVHSEQPTRNHWRVISRENVTHVLGFSPTARIADPADPSRIFQWLLECSFDDKGNVIVYRHKPEDLVGVDANLVSESHRTHGTTLIAGSHIESILYGNSAPFFAQSGSDYWPSVATLIGSADSFPEHWQFRAFFEYTAHEPDGLTSDNIAWSVRRDPFSSYRAGFEIRTSRLCQQVVFETNISIEIQGRETGHAGITHALFLRYENIAPGVQQQDRPGDPILTKLTSIQQKHLRKSSSAPPAYEIAEWPPLEFSYSAAAAMELKQISHYDAPAFPEGVDGSRYEWIDLDGEGIQGVLSRHEDAWWYAPNRWMSQSTQRGAPKDPISGGALHAQRPLRLQAASAIGDARAQLVDLAGDGSLDVLEYTDAGPLIYERNDHGGWDRPRVLPRRAAYSFNDPNLRMIDLDGDGRAELLISEDDCFVWQDALGEEGYGSVHRVAKMLDEKNGPRCVFREVTQTIFLADMSGDGLTDIVRIRNGQVCYWPNLGYGRFGARVTMDNAPVFDASDQFDPQRIRILDADGSGVADVIYLGRSRASVWANQSGNAWSDRQDIPFRLPHSFANVTATDFFGRGTSCLVWSSPAPADVGSHFHVVDLTGGIKPHLLVLVRNNLGAETAFSYRSSTEFYLKDLADGKPWITKLPFPVHVVDRVETRDVIARNRFVSRYAYHHGFFDGFEREFRGFGMVEQWDTDEIGVLSRERTGAENCQPDSYVPPKLTKTWFHHGAWFQEDSVAASFKATYWAGDPQAIDLPDSVMPADLGAADEREACRALRGRMLRQEIYAPDAAEDSEPSVKARATRPYETIEQNFTIRVLQPLGKNRQGVFFVHPREAVHAHYERSDPPDPRIKHVATLKVDGYGNVEQSIEIGYCRRQPEPVDPNDKLRQRLTRDEQTAQSRTLLTFTDSTFTNVVDNLADAWRAPLPSEARTYELTDPQWEKANALSFETLQEAAALFEEITEIAYEATPSYTRRERRLIEHLRTFYRSNDLKSLLPLGRVESLALPGEVLKLAFTPGLLGIYGDKASSDDIAGYLRDRTSGYAEPEGDGHFWIPSGRTFYSPDASGTPQGSAAELAFAQKRFFLPHRFVDPFGNATRVAYEDGILRIAEIIDAAENTTRAAYDYRVLQPKLLTDANGNRVAAAFDLRGLVAATAILGKSHPVGEFGDTLQGLKTDLSAAEVSEFFADPVGKAPDLLLKATSRFVYDVMRVVRASNADKPTSPVFAAALERKIHVDRPFAGDATAQRHAGLENFAIADHIQCRFSYSDGFGREIQQKIRTSPQIKDNPLQVKPPRWLGSGWIIFNNKGQPVRQYEPFFAEDAGSGLRPHWFEFRRIEGVSPIVFYDPLGRAVATMHPDHSWEKVVFDPWRKIAWDRNDTVLIDPLTDADVSAFFSRLPSAEWELIGEASPTWYKRRTTAAELDKLFPGTTDQAKWRRKQEADAAGQTADHAGTPTCTHFDALGREFLVVTHNRFIDPRSNMQKEEFAHTKATFDIEGNRRTVIDAFGRTVMAWDYDLLGRPLRETSMDAGSRWTLPDAASQPVCRWDEREHFFRYSYDWLRRPSENRITKQDKALGAEQADAICYERFTYGEHPDAPAGANLRGRIWKHYDTAGLVTVASYDAKGNLLASTREFCIDYKSTPDWSKDPALENEKYNSRADFDALNRVIRLITPDAHGKEQGSQTFSRYNLAGQLSARTVRAQRPGMMGFKWESFLIVRGIDYNARGQRRVIQYGNNHNGFGLRTTLTYDDRTFRLLGLVTSDTERAGSKYQSLDYVYDPVGNITGIQDSAQQTEFFKGQVVKPDAGYVYDALYRLIEASGREHSGQNLPPNAWDVHRAGTFNYACSFVPFPHPHDGKAMRNYTQRYAYDVVGNIEEMIHQAGAQGSWRRVYGYDLVPGSRDKRSNRLVSTTIGGETQRYAHDQHGSIVEMPHLPEMATDFRDQLSLTARQNVRCAADRPRTQGERTYYVYDGDGERVRKVTELNGKRANERRYLGTGETYRTYSGDGQDIAVERFSLHVSDGQRRFALFETRVKGSDDAARQLIRCQFPNHLGSACLEVQFESNPPIISYEEFHPYGTTSYQATNGKLSPVAKRYRFTGKERDEESGLNYHSARYLAPWLGRWMSADPIGIADSDNVYMYVKLNPVGSMDPTGLRHIDIVSGSPIDKNQLKSPERDVQDDNAGSAYVAWNNNLEGYSGTLPAPLEMMGAREDLPPRASSSTLRSWVREAAAYQKIPLEITSVLLQQENAPSASLLRKVLQFEERQITTALQVWDLALFDLIPDRIPGTGKRFTGGSTGIANLSRQTLLDAVSYSENKLGRPAFPKSAQRDRLGFHVDTRIAGIDKKADIFYQAALVRQLIDRAKHAPDYEGPLTIEDVRTVFRSYNGSGGAAQKYASDAVDKLIGASEGRTVLYFYEPQSKRSNTPANNRQK